MIWSTPLATYSVHRCSDIELIVLSLFLPPHHLSVQRGCHPFHATCLFRCCSYFPFSTGGLSSLSVDDQLVGFMEPTASSEFTVVHVTAVSCSPPQDSILVCDQLTIIIIDDSCSLLFSFGEIISVTLLFPAFSPFFNTSHRSSIKLSLFDLIFFLNSLCNVGTAHCFAI